MDSFNQLTYMLVSVLVLYVVSMYALIKKTCQVLLWFSD